MANQPNMGRDPESVGYRLRLTRVAIGVLDGGRPIAQGAFAEAAQLQPNTYNQFEQGRRLISVQAALQICDAYGITLDWIYAGDPSGLRYDLATVIREAQA